MRDWRSTRLVVLRHDTHPVQHVYNDLMERGSAWGHNECYANLGEFGEVLDVRLTADGDVVILYGMTSDGTVMRRDVW